MKAGEFSKLKLKQYAQVQARETSEAKYWKSFSNIIEEKLPAAATCIHFNPVDASSYLVTNSTRISLYDAATDRVQRSYSRFTEDAFSGQFRKDGKLIVAGDKTGSIKVFDVPTKSMLRLMKNTHTAAVRSTVWSSDGLHIVSGSDDKKVNRWDLATEQVLWSSKHAHTDYVRTVGASAVSANVFCSGSYDHTVKVWDSRQEAAALNITMGHPVEVSMFTPSGALLLTAGGNEVKIWDVLSGGKLLHTFSNHQKNVTGLCMDSTNTRVISCGLDGHMKVYSLSTLQVVHGMKFAQPLVSVGMSADGKKVAAGFVDGSFMVRNRAADNLRAPPGHNAQQQSTYAGDNEDADIDRMATGSGSDIVVGNGRFYKGAGMAAGDMSALGVSTDAIIETQRAPSLRPYEKMLRKFNYQKALDAALKTRNPVVVVTVLEELSRRSGLAIALSGRDEETLEPLMAFVARYTNHPKYSKLVIQVVHKILDLYAGVLGRSDVIDELFSKLQRQVKAEVSFQQDIMRVVGSLDGIISASMLNK